MSTSQAAVARDCSPPGLRPQKEKLYVIIRVIAHWTTLYQSRFESPVQRPAHIFAYHESIRHIRSEDPIGASGKYCDGIVTDSS
jgi:hypothetical protein